MLHSLSLCTIQQQQRVYLIFSDFFLALLFLLFFVQLCTRSRITNLSLRAIVHVFHVAVVEPLRLRHHVTTYARLVKAARILHAVTYLRTL